MSLVDSNQFIKHFQKLVDKQPYVDNDYINTEKGKSVYIKLPKYTEPLIELPYINGLQRVTQAYAETMYNKLVDMNVVYMNGQLGSYIFGYAPLVLGTLFITLTARL